MEANWLLLAVIAIIVICVIRGIMKGVLGILYSLCALIICLVIAYAISPKAVTWVQDNTGWYDGVESGIEKALEDKAKDTVSQGAGDAGASESFAESAAVLFSAAAQSTGMYETMAYEITDELFSAGAFLILFGVARIGLAIVYRIIRKAARLPVVSTINRFGGAVIGGVEGVLLAWLLMTLVVCLGVTAFGASAARCISGNEFLMLFYKQNPFMMML